MTRPPLPPFTEETAHIKIRAAEDAWNGQDPVKIALAYSADSEWRNRSTFVNGRDEIEVLLKDKWERELEYRLVKELWSFRVIGLPFGLPMKAAMLRTTGSDHTATKIGSSMPKASCSAASLVLMML